MNITKWCKSSLSCFQLKIYFLYCLLLVLFLSNSLILFFLKKIFIGRNTHILQEQSIQSKSDKEVSKISALDTKLLFQTIEKIVDELSCVPELSTQNLDLITRTIYEQVKDDKKIDLSGLELV